MMAKRAIDASQQFDYRNDRLRGGRERSSAEWGTRRCSPQTGMAELGGIKLGRMKLYSTAKRVAQLRFFNHGFRALCRPIPALTAYATKKGRSLVLAFWRSATDHSRRRAAPTHRTRLLYPTPLLSKAFGSTRRNDDGSPGAARRSTAKPQVFVHRRHDVRQST